MAALGLRALLRRTRDRRAHEQPWPQTMGTILSASVQVSSRGAVRTEHPLIFYAYQVDGQVFQGNRLRRNGNGAHAATALVRYPAGASVVVYYDPANPGHSALEL